MFDVPLYRLFIAFLALYFIAVRLWKFIRKERSQSFFKLLTFLVVWTGVLIFSLFPNLALTLSIKLGLAENLNPLIFIGFIVTFVVIFKLLSIIEKIERNITEIVRKQALKDFEGNLIKKRK